MNVDKAKFLFLTTALSAATAVALSASGCTVQEKEKDTGSSGSTPTDSGGGGTDATTDGYTDSSTEGVDSGDGGACLGDDGVAPTCSDAGTGYTCEDACDRYGVNFKKGIARSIHDCFYKLPTCEGADADKLACVDSAAKAACADPTAATYCATLYCTTSTAAGTLQQADCEAVAKLLSSTGRTNFTTCITEAGGPCSATADLCIDAIE